MKEIETNEKEECEKEEDGRNIKEIHGLQVENSFKENYWSKCQKTAQASN